MRLRRRPGEAVQLPVLVDAPKVSELPDAKLQAGARYLGTTTAGSDALVTTHGLASRTMARLSLSAEALDVIRLGASFRIPAGALRSARQESEFAGKQVKEPGALVVRWEHGEQLLDTGFRFAPVSPVKGSKGSAPAPEDDSQTSDRQRQWVRTIGKIARNAA